MAKLKVTLVHSAAHRLPRQRKIVKALGFHHVNSTIVRTDNEAIRGALFHIAHLIKVQQVK